MANLETLLCSLKAILSCNAINASHVNLICDHIKSSNVWIRRTRGLMIWGTQQAKEYWQALSILSSGSPRWAEVLGTFQKEKKKVLLPNFILHQYSSPYVLMQGDSASEKCMISAALRSERLEPPIKPALIAWKFPAGWLFSSTVN